MYTDAFETLAATVDEDLEVLADFEQAIRSSDLGETVRSELFTQVTTHQDHLRELKAVLLGEPSRALVTERERLERIRTDLRSGEGDADDSDRGILAWDASRPDDDGE
ncbi:MAG: hypothetical protein KAY37_11640 [Phycisphaerae bacterium]|nr:hypothetical protein [Phycisphaerae bacterium]